VIGVFVFIDLGCVFSLAQSDGSRIGLADCGHGDQAIASRLFQQGKH
jgi:hypothetical protein